MKKLCILSLSFQASDLFIGSPRRRSNAFTESTDEFHFTGIDSAQTLPPSRPRAPLYHSHRESRLKADIGAHFLRGDGFFSYHVYEVRVS